MPHLHAAIESRTDGPDHPDWCSPEHCQTDAAGEHWHRSAPLTWRLASGDAEVELCRYQIGGVASERVFEMSLRNLDEPAHTVTVEMGRADLMIFLASWDHLNELA